MAGYEVPLKYFKTNDYINQVKTRLEPHFQVISSAAYKISEEMKINKLNKDRKSKL